MKKTKLAIVLTHPVQYHAAVFRELAKYKELDLTVFFGSTHGSTSSFDEEFGVSFKWDCNVLRGYKSVFISQGGLQDLRKYRSAYRLAKKTANEIKKFNPEHVLIMGYVPIYYYFLTIFLKKQKRHLLFRAETTDKAKKRGKIKSTFRQYFLKEFYLNFDHFFAIGVNSREHFLEHLVQRSQITTCQYSVDTNFVRKQVRKYLPKRSAIRKKLGIDLGNFVIMFCGKMIDKKNPLMITKALLLLDKKSLERIFLVAVGEGELREQFEKKAKEVLGKRVHFSGFKNQTQIGEYYSAADLLVLPSKRDETWGLVVNEALEYSLYCVVSDRVGCGKDLIKSGKNGGIFKYNDPKDLSAKIEKCMKTIIFKKTQLPTENKTAAAIYNSISADQENSSKPNVKIINSRRDS